MLTDVMKKLLVSIDASLDCYWSHMLSLSPAVASLVVAANHVPPLIVSLLVVSPLVLSSCCYYELLLVLVSAFDDL